MNVDARVLAVRRLNFLDDRQQPVMGHQVYVAAVTDEPGWVKGVEVVKVWVPDGSPQETTAAALLPNDEIRITFNRRGKPVLVDP